MSETKHKMHPTHSQHSISSVQHVNAYLHSANTDRSYSFVKEEKRKYPWDIRIQCATEQKPKIIKCISWIEQRDDMNFFKSKCPKQNTKCIPHIHSTQSQASNICTRTYICGISFERTLLKGARTSTNNHSTSLCIDFLSWIKNYERCSYRLVTEHNQKS